jgi:hypothetical protein
MTMSEPLTWPVLTRPEVDGFNPTGGIIVFNVQLHITISNLKGTFDDLRTNTFATGRWIHCYH